MAPKRKDTTTPTTDKTLEQGEASRPKKRKSATLKITHSTPIVVIPPSPLISNEPVTEHNPLLKAESSKPKRKRALSAKKVTPLPLVQTPPTVEIPPLAQDQLPMHALNWYNHGKSMLLYNIFFYNISQAPTPTFVSTNPLEAPNPKSEFVSTNPLAAPTPTFQFL